MGRVLTSLCVLALAACGADSVTDSEQYEEVEAEQSLGEAEQETFEQTPGADPDGDEMRAGDMPDTGEEMTRWPVEPGSGEPGGKDDLTEEEREAMDEGEDPSDLADPPRR